MMKKTLILSILALLIPIFILLSLTVGAFRIDFAIALKTLLIPTSNPDPTAQAVIWNIRFPRALMGLIAGITLALAGVALQGALRNPLVSPFTIGISSGASFGAALAIVAGIGFTGFGPYLIMTNAFFFALITSGIVMGIAKLKGMSSEAVILVGVAMTYLFSAGVTFLQYFAHEWNLRNLVYWLMGDLVLANWERVLLAIPAFLVCIPLFKYAWDLNVLMAGEEQALSLGTNPTRTRFACAILASLAVATVVCLSGPIGFICLVAPHIARLLVGADYRFAMLGSGLIGGLLLVLADMVARIILAPVELPVGVLTAFLGVPLFIHLILRAKQKIWI